MWVLIGVGLFLAFCVVAVVHDQRAGIPQAKAAAAAAQGRKVVCPHCQTPGHVTTRAVKVKRGISGGKATGAVLTGGVSMLATGLSRKQKVTQARCRNCGSDWTF